MHSHTTKNKYGRVLHIRIVHSIKGSRTIQCWVLNGVCVMNVRRGNRKLRLWRYAGEITTQHRFYKKKGGNLMFKGTKKFSSSVEAVGVNLPAYRNLNTEMMMFRHREWSITTFSCKYWNQRTKLVRRLIMEMITIDMRRCVWGKIFVGWKTNHHPKRGANSFFNPALVGSRGLSSSSRDMK